MSNSDYVYEPLKKAAISAGARKWMRTMVVLLLLCVSLTCLSLQLARVSSAIGNWAILKQRAMGDDVDDALRVVNSEEMLSIPPMLLTAAASALAFRLVNLKIIPRQCYYCGRMISAKKAKQPPDKSLFWCEECESSLHLSGMKTSVKVWE